MIFMAADNDLDLFASKDLSEMMRLGSSDAVNIIAEVDRRRAFLNEDQSQLNTKRYLIEKGTLTEFADVGETNTGDFHTPQNFIQWGMQNYPAEAYFVDIWNHGGA